MFTVEVIGRVVADAEVKQFSDGTKYITFRFAAEDLSRKQDGKPVTLWFQILSTQPHHVMMKQYLVKGKPCFIRGTYSDNLYTTQNGLQEIGRNVRATEITFTPGSNEQQKTTVTLPNGVTTQVSRGVVEAQGYQQVQQPQTVQQVQPQQPVQAQPQQVVQQVAPQVMPQQQAPQTYVQPVAPQPVQNPAPVQAAINPATYDDPADNLPF